MPTSLVLIRFLSVTLDCEVLVQNRLTVITYLMDGGLTLFLFLRPKLERSVVSVFVCYLSLPNRSLNLNLNSLINYVVTILFMYEYFTIVYV